MCSGSSGSLADERLRHDQTRASRLCDKARCSDDVNLTVIDEMIMFSNMLMSSLMDGLVQRSSGS